MGFPIRISTVNNGRSAPHRGFSQPPTSFIGSVCLGIHRWPFVAWISFLQKMLVLAMKFSRDTRRRSRGHQPAQRADRQGRKRRQRETAPSGALSQRKRGTLHTDSSGRGLRNIITSASTGILVTVVTSLLRKEVIQPHLPVRLPCYDFTPIANPTFGSSLPKGLGH